MDSLYKKLADLSAAYGASRLVLFGSRARRDCRPQSDIDLAVYGMPKEKQTAFWTATEELPSLLKFDIIHVTSHTNPELIKNIKKDGIILMDKMQEKYEHFSSAVDRLRESLADYEKFPLDSVRDGVIQRFEFCTELSWKTMREYLLDQGFTELNSPKSVIRQAYAAGLIENENLWISLLSDRNLTSRLCDEETAGEIFSRIKNDYAGLFDILVKKLAL